MGITDEYDDKFIKPTAGEQLKALESVLTWADEVSRNLKEGPGGDHYVYEGSMSAAEALREKINEYHQLFLRLKGKQ